MRPTRAGSGFRVPGAVAAGASRRSVRRVTFELVTLALLTLAMLLAACGGSAKSVAGSGPGATLAITVSGLPAGASGRVTVTGPNGYAHDVASSTQLHGLADGAYHIAAGYVNAQSQTWTAALSADSVFLLGPDTTSISATYTGGAVTSLDLRVSGTQLLQSTQRADGSMPMIGLRDALLRVFVTANAANTERPAVRVRLFQGATQVDSIDVTGPAGGVPLAADTATLGSSWNVLIPAARVLSGMSYQVEVDPGDAIAETDESDNRWPGTSTHQTVTVQSVPVLDLTYVPIRQSVNNLTGQVSAGNKDALSAATRSMWPIGAATIGIHATYTTATAAYQSNDGNGSWSQTLSEISALKSTESSSSDYVGILQVTYGGGIAGLGYVGYPAAIAWDKAGSAPGVIAHELGHNFGRNHAPCGSPSGPDPLYPYPNADIGTWGLDLPALSLKAPGTYKDLMSYCNPDWVSDYNYAAVLASRDIAGSVRPVGAVTGPGMLIWGRIINGSVILEPSFMVQAPARLPSEPGPHRVEAFDAAGGRIFSLSFSGELVADLPAGAERHFAYVVPLSAQEQARVAALRLTGNGLTTMRLPLRAATGVPAAPEVGAVRAGTETRVQWNPAYPMALVRDAASGEVLSFARGGVVQVPAGRAGVSVQLSDGVVTLPKVTVRAP